MQRTNSCVRSTSRRNCIQKLSRKRIQPWVALYCKYSLSVLQLCVVTHATRGARSGVDNSWKQARLVGTNRHIAIKRPARHLAICCILLLPQHLNLAQHCSSRCLRGGTQTSQLNATTKLFRWHEHTASHVQRSCLQPIWLRALIWLRAFQES
jgi:hypothetical protein